MDGQQGNLTRIMRKKGTFVCPVQTIVTPPRIFPTWLHSRGEGGIGGVTFRRRCVDENRCFSQRICVPARPDGRTEGKGGSVGGGLGEDDDVQGDPVK